jgi:hypothetical protein
MALSFYGAFIKPILGKKNQNVSIFGAGHNSSTFGLTYLPIRAMK